MKKLDLTFPKIWYPWDDKYLMEYYSVISKLRRLIDNCLYHADRYYVLTFLRRYDDADWHDTQIHESLVTLSGYLSALVQVGLIDGEDYWHIYGVTVSAARHHQHNGYRGYRS